MKKKRSYSDSVHFYGIIWDIAALLVFMMIPISICMHLNVWPEAKYVLKGLLPVAMIFYPSAVIEVITYTPLLGLNAMENAGVRANSEEGEVVSTIAIATSSIVTTVIIALGVLVFSPLLPYITAEDSPLTPAFNQVVPALFGALGISYFSKHWKISIIPLAVIVIVLLINGSVGSGVLIPIGVVVALLSTHLLYKKGWVK